MLAILFWQYRPPPQRFSRVQVVYSSAEHHALWLPEPEENTPSKGGSIPPILPAASVGPVNDQPAGGNDTNPPAAPSEIDTSISGILASESGSPGSLPGRLQDMPYLQTGSSDIPAPAPPETEPQQASVEIPSHLAPRTLRVEPARLLKKMIPVYPQIARTARVEGDVTIQADITESGRLENVSAIDGHPLLIDSAVEAVRQWRYAPARLNGAPTRSSVNVTVRFRLIYQ
ncbi:MAG TPA: energy transducer TonB [Terriglobia bacterium]|jgi:protein TonB